MKEFNPQVKRRNSWKLSLKVIGLLCLFTLLPSSSSLPGASEISYTPSAEDQELVRQVEAWRNFDRNEISRRELRERIQEQAESFALFRDLHHAAVLEDALRELPFGDLIQRAAEEHRVDPLLLAAMVEVESGFNPRAVSYRGAVGLLQVMPATAGTTDNFAVLHHPESNLRAGARYMKRLLKKYDGDWIVALAAYNAGPGNVRRYRGIPPFRETQGYVDKVLSRYVDHLHGIHHAERRRDMTASVVAEATTIPA